MIARAQELEIPVENLISPDALRKLVWHNPPAASDSELQAYASSTLLAASARPWQAKQVAGLLVEALKATEPLAVPEPAEQAEPEQADL